MCLCTIPTKNLLKQAIIYYSDKHIYYILHCSHNGQYFSVKKFDHTYNSLCASVIDFVIISGRMWWKILIVWSFMAWIDNTHLHNIISIKALDSTLSEWLELGGQGVLCLTNWFFTLPFIYNNTRISIPIIVDTVLINGVGLLFMC